ncbi:MAG: hypothetical protein ACK40G_12470 [Cytophagaceae bacterium]
MNVLGPALSILIMILLLPFILISLPFVMINDRIEKKKFRIYLEYIGDKNFFCYNNRSDCKGFIENELLNNLKDCNIELIFLDGKTPKSDYNPNYISRALYELKNYRRFPHLLKIRNGNLIDKSINNSVFNTINKNKSMESLLEEIKEFFD